MNGLRVFELLGVTSASDELIDTTPVDPKSASYLPKKEMSNLNFWEIYKVRL